MNGLQIRPATPADWEVIVDYNCRLALESEGKQLDRQHLVPGVQALLANPQRGRYLLAERNGQVVGQLMHTHEWSDWRNGDIWWLQSVYVHPDFRRQGVFRALHAQLEAEALADPGVVGLRLYVEEQNTRAHATYAAMGMTPGGYFVLERWLRRAVVGSPAKPAPPVSPAGGEELFDVCDEHDRVIDTLPRSVVHARGLWHRAVHVFVFNSRGELLLQLRSQHKDEAPLQYTSSASGHLNAGEDYATAAPRELQEELGISAELEFVVKLPASPETAREHTVLYQAVCDEALHPDPYEIAEVSFHPLPEVAAMLDRDRGRFSVCFQTLFAWYMTHRAGGPASS
ncbi:MAG: GNAT family N-acetyltransferase [Planctomycetaceae bacterium]